VRDSFSRIAGSGEILRFDGGNGLTRLDVVAFLYGERLDASLNARADDDFVGIDGANELEIAGAIVEKK